MTTSAANSPLMTAIRPNASAASVCKTKMKAPPRPPLERAPAVQGAHQHGEIEPGDMDQVALVDVLASAQPGPAHAAAIEDMAKERSTSSPRRRIVSRPIRDFSRARLA
jgi:hypothetical protein